MTHAIAISTLLLEIDYRMSVRHDLGGRDEIRDLCRAVRVLQRPETHRQLRNMQAQLSRLGMRYAYREKQLGTWEQCQRELERLRRLERSFNVVAATSSAKVAEHTAKAEAFKYRAENELLRAEIAELRREASTAPTGEDPTPPESEPRPCR